MSYCNYCSYKFIKNEAALEGKVVTKIQSRFELGGVDILVHPKDVNVKDLEGIHIPDHPNRMKYFVAWFMEVPTSCKC